jgi:hypothetical protein
MNERIKTLTDFLEKTFPQAFHAAHPRNVTPPPGYTNPRYYAASMVGNLMVVRDPAMNQLPHLTAYMTTLALMANKMPTYFIAYEFCLAVANTDLPLDFKFAEIKWPLNAQLFVLPDQFVAQYFGCHAPFIAVTRCPAGKYPDVLKVPSVEIPYTPMNNHADKLAVDYPVYHGMNTPIDYNGNYPMSMGIEVFKSAAWVDSTIYEEEYHGFTYKASGNELAGDAEKIYVNKMLMFAMKLLMAVSCRPGLVEHGQCTRLMKIKKGRVAHRDMWSPNVIGRSYKIPRQGIITTGSTGPRSKPRFTFRRGHYTWQAKRFKDVEFVSVEAMPHKEDGTIDFDTAGTPLADKFRTVHERLWIEGILLGDGADSPSNSCATPS